MKSTKTAKFIVLKKFPLYGMYFTVMYKEDLSTIRKPHKNLNLTKFNTHTVHKYNLNGYITYICLYIMYSKFYKWKYIFIKYSLAGLYFGTIDSA